MKRLGLLLCLALCFLSCGWTPKGIISRSKMEDILCDLYRTDGTVYALHLQTGDDPTCDSIYANLLRKYGITQADFDSSMAYYNSRAAVFEKMYLQVDNRLMAEFKEAQLAADWADAEQRCQLIGWPEKKQTVTYTWQIPQVPNETLSQPKTYLPDPKSFRHNY